MKSWTVRYVVLTFVVRHRPAVPQQLLGNRVLLWLDFL